MFFTVNTWKPLKYFLQISKSSSIFINYPNFGQEFQKNVPRIFLSGTRKVLYILSSWCFKKLRSPQNFLNFHELFRKIRSHYSQLQILFVFGFFKIYLQIQFPKFFSNPPSLRIFIKIRKFLLKSAKSFLNFTISEVPINKAIFVKDLKQIFKIIHDLCKVVDSLKNKFKKQSLFFF